MKSPTQVDAIRISVLAHSALRKYCLPIAQSTRLELVISLNAAQAIGLTVPRSFLVRGQGDRINDVMSAIGP
jgi:hypothetical protein